MLPFRSRLGSCPDRRRRTSALRSAWHLLQVLQVAGIKVRLSLSPPRQGATGAEDVRRAPTLTPAQMLLDAMMRMDRYALYCA
jgi:hypothetical protein